MTLKTTKEQRAKWVRWAQSKCRIMLELSDIEDLCHDADRAWELEKELETGRKAWKLIGQALRQEIDDLRAKLDAAYERAALTCEKEITGGDYHYLAVHGHHDCMAQAAVNCAAAIRALKEQDKP